MDCGSAKHGAIRSLYSVWHDVTYGDLVDDPQERGERMKIESSRDIYHNYRILSDGKTPDCHSYTVRMMTENHIPGFLDCHIQEIDSSTRYLYDVTSMQSLEDILESGKITGQLLELLYSSVLAAIRNLEDFLLDENGIQMSPELIFLNAERTRIYFIYYPDEEESCSGQMKRLGEMILPHLDHGDKKSVIMGYAFYQKAAEGNISVGEFQKLLEECRPNPMPESKGVSEEEERERREQRERILDEFFEEDEKSSGEGLFARVRNWFSRRRQENGKPDEEGAAIMREFFPDGKRQKPTNRSETSLANDVNTIAGKLPEEMAGRLSTGRSESSDDRVADDEDGWKETVLLAAGGQETEDRRVQALLLPEGREQDSGGGSRNVRTDRLELWKRNHILGKSRKSADLILNVPTVSRIHARFVYRENGYSIIDLNSKNGTLRNGELLVPGEAYPLHDGDRLRFSDQCFMYHRAGIVQPPSESV